jgi:hypothetical protein
MDIKISARLTSWGLYQRGERRDISISFPTTREEVQKALKAICVDGIRDRRVILTEYDSNLSGFCHCLTQYDSVDEVNYLAHLLSDLSESEFATFQSVLEYGEHDQCAGDLINLALNLDCYELHPGVDTDEELDRIYAEFDEDIIEVPEALKNYFDYEAYGRDNRLNEGGCFVDGSYLTRDPGGFVEQYAGPEDIPPKYRAFAYPKLNIKERLAACKEVTEQAAR